MTFAIASHVIHGKEGDSFYGYAPYVKEMNIWFKHVDEVIVVAPLQKRRVKSKIDANYSAKRIKMNAVPAIHFTSLFSIIKSVCSLPIIILKLYLAFRKADHIHLRCPGNIGLLGCLVQVLFPHKQKTAKYAGNWDPNAQQPNSYKFQKWVLSNTFLTRNMKVLVYGEWENQSSNIKPFFTASFKSADRINYTEKAYSKKLQFVFVGALVEGKRPFLAIDIIKGLIEKGKSAELQVYGDGPLRQALELYTEELGISSHVNFYGNQPLNNLKLAYQSAHFAILPSKSEGWPKAIAEAMFFGVIPISTAVSCVPSMLDHGQRGILIAPEAKLAVEEIYGLLNQKTELKNKSEKALKWSQNYTIERFESEIKQLLA
ncbi:MAG: glycosyl transferase [Bacteroidetes bacterium MedPE-SWsnd-G2]|nr:MAG: glycosyl transferase [Bacteroidetes bacterium MedPE-SWsnd-G2]